MNRLVSFALAVAISASAANAENAVTQQSYNYSEWTKGLFAEAVTVTGLENAKAVFLGGIGAEEENGKPGDIRTPGDITGQCKYTFEKIEIVLKKNGATLQDIVKMTSYLTSSDAIGAYIGCRNRAFEAAGADLPSETLLIISGLAWPDMLMEVDVNAITEK